MGNQEQGTDKASPSGASSGSKPSQDNRVEKASPDKGLGRQSPSRKADDDPEERIASGELDAGKVADTEADDEASDRNKGTGEEPGSRPR
jgi:hypothetical protein